MLLSTHSYRWSVMVSLLFTERSIPMTELRRRMIEDMRLNGFPPMNLCAGFFSMCYPRELIRYVTMGYGIPQTGVGCIRCRSYSLATNPSLLTKETCPRKRYWQSLGPLKKPAPIVVRAFSFSSTISLAQGGRRHDESPQFDSQHH
jgi:hypothetical protein